MNREEKIAKALRIYEKPKYQSDYDLFINSPAGEKAIRERVRELWCVDTMHFIEINIDKEECELVLFKCKKVPMKGTSIWATETDYPFQESVLVDDEAEVWEEALLWLAERGSDAKD